MRTGSCQIFIGERERVHGKAISPSESPISIIPPACQQAALSLPRTSDAGCDRRIVLQASRPDFLAAAQAKAVFIRFDPSEGRVDRRTLRLASAGLRQRHRLHLHQCATNAQRSLSRARPAHGLPRKVGPARAAPDVLQRAWHGDDRDLAPCSAHQKHRHADGPDHGGGCAAYDQGSQGRMAIGAHHQHGARPLRDHVGDHRLRFTGL